MSSKKTGEFKSAQGGKRPKTTKPNVVAAPTTPAAPAPAPPAPPPPAVSEDRQAREAAEKLSAELHTVVQNLTEKASGLEANVTKLTADLDQARKDLEAEKQKAAAPAATSEETQKLKADTTYIVKFREKTTSLEKEWAFTTKK